MLRTEIIDADGIKGEITGITSDERELVVRLPNEAVVNIPVDRINFKDEHTVYLLAPFDSYLEHGEDAIGSQERVIPVIEEIPKIEKRFVDIAKVKVRKSVNTRVETLTETLSKERVDIKRVAFDKVVSAPAQMRVEGDTTIIPVQEEILVVEKRILLKEEIHIRRVTSQEEQNIDVELRTEAIDIQREDLAVADSGDDIQKI